MPILVKLAKKDGLTNLYHFVRHIPLVLQDVK